MRTLKTFVLVAVPLALCLAALERPALRAQTKVPPAARPVDRASLDAAADPCTDFYQYACGGWMASQEIPPDQSRWGRFNELEERNRAILLGILEKAAENRPDRNPIAQKLGDYFATCMDVKAADSRGSAPLAREIARIEAMTAVAELPAVVGHLHAIGTGALFGFGSEQDFKNAARVLAIADQGGLSLPDRDYYLNDDAKSVEIRQKFEEHVGRMFVLLGDAPEAARQNAKTVMDLETALARVSMDRVARRDPSNLYHLHTRKELDALTPSFDWSRYLAVVGAPPIEEINVVVPAFFKGVDSLMTSKDLPAWKTYLRWRLLRDNAPLLSTAFVDENFAFNGRVLLGQKQIRAREKRCADYVDDDLGEALGQPYVEATFGAEGKKRMLELVAALERSLQKNVEALPWMTDATRKQALVKLAAIRNKIGYPDTWRDYAPLEIVRGDLVGNSWRANTFELRRQLAKIGKPVDRGEWGMSPPTVNAYYNPLMNDVNFPAGILQPPFFFREADDAVNFGAIGAVIGHELTHGFDDMGRQFDADGNLRDWWTPEDAKEFEHRTSCFVDQYSSYAAIDEVKLNGKLTLGENVADAGGLRIAYMALMDTLQGKDAAPVDGFSPGQRFFLGWGQVWCQNTRPETARMLAKVDPHSPGRYRVNGVVSNMPEFAKAFGCKADAPMVRGQMCRVW
jgi:endothelin-converting enzyme/putative endopeptidase